MATGPTLKMSADIAQRIREHGAETYPHECCGALLGRDASEDVREVRGLFPLVNRRDDSPRNRFSVTAEDVREAEKGRRVRAWTWWAGIIRIRIIRRGRVNTIAIMLGRGTAILLLVCRPGHRGI